MRTGYAQLLLIVLAGMVMLGCGREGTQVTTPRPPPGVEGLAVLQGADASKVSLSEYRGTVLLLDFWVPWSLPCRDAAPDLERMHKDLAGQSFSVVGMTLVEDATPPVMEDIASLGLSYPVLLADDEARRTYGTIRAIPTRVLIGRDGSPVRSYPGSVSMEELRNEVEKVLRGEALAPIR